MNGGLKIIDFTIEFELKPATLEFPLPAIATRIDRVILRLIMAHPSQISYILFIEYIFAIKKGALISKILLKKFS